LLTVSVNLFTKSVVYIVTIAVCKINETNEFIHFTLILTENNNVLTKDIMLILAIGFTYLVYGETKMLIKFRPVI
jgi:hypothetical protein